MFREEMPQTHRDHAMSCRQRAQHRQPDAEVAKRAVDAHQRRALPDIEVGHVISVDAEALHAGSLVDQEARGLRLLPGGRPGQKTLNSGAGLPESGWIATFSKPRFRKL